MAAPAAPLRRLALADLREHLRSLILDLGWSVRFPLLVSAGECPVAGSPSVQLWITARGEGDPVVEGIFDQVVEGPGAEWTGPMPTRLAAPRRAELAAEAVLRAVLFQELGYYGRCSFDAILVGEDPATAAVHGWSTRRQNGYYGTMSDIAYVSEVEIERDRGPLRFARLPAEAEPVTFGVHGAIAEHYGVPADAFEPHATTLDYVVAAAGG